MSTPGSRATHPPLVYLIFSSVEAIVADLLRRLEAAGFGDIRSTHDCVFRYLDVGGTRLSLLAERAELTKQAIGEHVDYLERQGYVTRAPDPSDRRAKLVIPTERGRAIKAAVQEAFADMEREWGEAAGARALRSTMTVLSLISGDRCAGHRCVGHH